MKDSGDDNAVSIRLIEDDVFALLEAADTGEDRIAGPTQTRRISQQMEAPFQLPNVVFGLLFAPGIDCVIEYFGEIRCATWA
jgi:hypothetical protein